MSTKVMPLAPSQLTDLRYLLGLPEASTTVDWREECERLLALLDLDREEHALEVKEITDLAEKTIAEATAPPKEPTRREWILANAARFAAARFAQRTSSAVEAMESLHVLADALGLKDPGEPR